jgi:tol-pal system protein YbgF
MNKRLTWVWLLLLLPIASAGTDKEKKAYELIYQDVQLLKKQILQLQEKIEKNAENINTLKEQTKELLNLAKLLQTDQAGLKADQAKIPSQYQVVLDKLETLNQQLVKVSEDLIEIKRFPTLLPQLLPQPQPQQPQPQQEEKKETKEAQKKQPSGKKAKEVKKEEQASAPAQPTPQAPSQPPPTARLSPQEVFNMANSDYLKGNFDLAIAGFKMYMEQFPESPLVDDCLYWIGECDFSQKKFKEAVDQFNDLILNYPNGNKIPEAYLKKGICLEELGQKEEALSVYKLLVSKFPLEEETKIAQQKIKELTTKK